MHDDGDREARNGSKIRNRVPHVEIDGPIEWPLYLLWLAR
jgi:hypothetical protein